MTPKVIVMTGATHGIGAAAARRLAAIGHRVVIIGRCERKAAALARELDTDWFVADFSRLDEVRALAERLLCRYPRIDVLANNADTPLLLQHGLTADGHDVTFQMNYLAGFLLTLRLIDRLVRSRATVICRSSAVHVFGRLDVDRLGARYYSATRAYCDSMLAQILFARELYRRYGPRGLATAAFQSTPSASGADTLAFLAEGRPDVDFACGHYYAVRSIAKASRRASDHMLAFDLWSRSESILAAMPRHSMSTTREALAA